MKGLLIDFQKLIVYTKTGNDDNRMAAVILFSYFTGNAFGFPMKQKHSVGMRRNAYGKVKIQG